MNKLPLKEEVKGSSSNTNRSSSTGSYFGALEVFGGSSIGKTDPFHIMDTINDYKSHIGDSQTSEEKNEANNDR
eukprot:2875687-Pyramimonas_sp.AAC.1